MAKKLSKAELQKAQTDFDSPQMPKAQTLEQIRRGMDSMELGILENFLAGVLTPAQMKSFVKRHPALASYAPKSKKAAPASVQKEKHAGGRPAKADEPLRVCSFRLRESDYRKIKAVAASQGKTAGDLISGFISTLPNTVKF